MIIETYNDLFKVLIQSSILFILYFLMYRKYVYSIFDPLFFFIVTQAFSTELGILKISDSGYLLNFIFCQALFVLGFLLALRSFSKDNQLIKTSMIINDYSLRVLKYYCVAGFILISIANLIFFYQKGMLLLSDDPTTAKTTEFEGGFGIVKRVNWGLLPLISVVCIFLLILTEHLLYLTILVVLILYSASGGGKGTIMTFLYTISLFSSTKSMKSKRYYKLLNKMQVPIGVLAIILAMYIFSTTSEDMEQTILAAGIRFLYFGDVILYYYEPESVRHFQQLNFIDFISREFNSILGLFRIVDYVNPIGYEMVVYSLNIDEQLDSIRGPNAPFYVKGHIFFGWIGALVYSFAVGYFVGFIRNKICQIRTKDTISINLCWIIFINSLIFSFPQDSSLFISYCFDAVLFSICPLVLAMVFDKVMCFIYD